MGLIVLTAESAGSDLEARRRIRRRKVTNQFFWRLYPFAISVDVDKTMRSSVGSGIATVRGRLDFASKFYDSACRACGLSVDGERVPRLEIKVPFDAEAELEPDRGDFGEARVAHLGSAEAEVTQPKERVAVLGIKLREQPRRGPTGIEEFYDRLVILIAIPTIDE